MCSYEITTMPENLYILETESSGGYTGKRLNVLLTLSPPDSTTRLTRMFSKEKYDNGLVLVEWQMNHPVG
ncbi:hypothetical protein AN958_12665 [Leucoagaricus sp. SymC.cos]|nr:hypothetical protein AN958_12665 [Leucoagaricus sp. SymC.cos]